MAYKQFCRKRQGEKSGTEEYQYLMPVIYCIEQGLKRFVL